MGILPRHSLPAHGGCFVFKAEPGCGCRDSLAFPSRGWGGPSPSFPAPLVQPRADSGDWSPVRSIGSVSGRGVWRTLPRSRGCGPWASLLPLHSTYQEESMSGTHSPTVPLLVPQGPDSYLKSRLLRPPAAPGGAQP